MLTRYQVALALLLLCGTAQAEPPSDAPRAAPSADELRVRASDRRRLPPEMMERLRNRVRSPADGSRVQGRTARLRERAFDEAVKDPDGKGGDISARMQELREHSAELRRERRRTQHARWGQTALEPKAKAELGLHGSRMAKIRRMQFLALTERKGEARAAILERLARLKDLERGRHERAMQALVAGQKPTKPAPSSATKVAAP